MKNITKALVGSLLGLSLALIPLGSAFAALVLAVQSISPSTTIAPGTTVTLTVTASGFSSPIFRLVDSFGNNTTATIDSNGNFRWTPNSNELGTHIFTFTVTDSVGNVATAQQQLVVSNSGNSTNNSLSIQSLFPSSSVNPGQQVLFTAVASGFTNPTYSVSDNFFGGTSIRSNFINSNGNFNWTPQTQDIGTHTITVFVSDSTGRTATANTTITVLGNGNNNGSTNISNLFPGSSVNTNQQVTFSVVNTGLSGNLTYTLFDARSGSSVTSSNINSSGFFSWIPNLNDVGTHPITITVRDSFNNTRTAQTTLTVFNNGGSNFNTNQSMIDILTAQLESLKAQLAALLGNGSFNNNFNNFGNPTATVPVAGTGSSFDGFSGNFGGSFFGTLGFGSTGSQVTSLQIRLSNLGFFFGQPTGFFGSQTQSAVLNFQASRGLPQTGFVDSATFSALGGF